jgi:hypothetical protein
MAKQLTKDQQLSKLADRLGKAFLDELRAQKRFQNEHNFKLASARTPSAEDKASVRAIKTVWLSKSRVRIGIVAEMETLLGIEKPQKPPGELIDKMPDTEPE